MKTPVFLCVAFCNLCVFVANAFAVPPSITHIYPAGAKRGTTVEVTVAGTFERWPVKVWTSDKSITATASKDKGKLSLTVAADAVPGVHWLRLHDEQGASTLRPFIVGTLPDVLDREPNDENANAQAIENSSVVNGRLEKAGDVDVFAMKLTKGQTLVASLEAFQTLRSLMDAVLQIVSVDGFVLEQNNDWSGLDPQIVFPVPKDGTYLVRLFAFPSAPDSSIRLAGAATYIYRLTLTAGGFVDHTMPLAVTRAPNATVNIEGWNIPADAKTLPVAMKGDVSSVFHPSLANAFAVKIEDHPCWDNLKPDGKREPYSPPFSLTGRLLKAGTPDVLRVACKKGQSLSIRVDSRELGLMVNPVIRVLDPDGKQLARAEPPAINKDATLAFTPTADGIYVIEVRDLHGRSGPRFVYRLRVSPPEPDFDLAVASDRFALAPGKPLDIPVTVTRRGGFGKEIDLVVEGLPADVKFENVPAPKGDTKTLTLRLTTEKAGPSAAFRIMGKAKEPSLARTARAPLAEFDSTTTDLWLAVGGEVPPPKPKNKR
jgi:hypothetical protein